MPTLGLDRIRRNHSLEHATVALLLQRGTRAPIGGYSIASGFVIWAKASPEAISDAAHEALRLLNDGHSDLAISPYCGTNYVVSAVLGGLAAYFAGKGTGVWPKIRGVAAGLMVGGVLSQPVGKLVQRRLTTDSHLSGTEIRSVRTLKGAPVSVLWVSTGSSVDKQ